MGSVALVICGVHRSGTSATSGAAHIYGFHLGKSIAQTAPDNERGFWENEALVKANEALLASIGHRWDAIHPIVPGAFQQPEATVARQVLSETFDRELERRDRILIKDPRCCRLLPVWRDMLDLYGYKPHYLFVMRHPLEVAASLMHRNGFSVTKSLWMWLRHYLEAEAATRGEKRAWIQYGELLQNPAVMLRAFQVLGIEPPVPGRDVELREFLAPDLRHHHVAEEVVSKRRALSSWCADLYDASLMAETDPDGMRAVFDRVSAEVGAGDEMFWPEFWLRETELIKKAGDIQTEANHLYTRFLDLEKRYKIEVEGRHDHIATEVIRLESEGAALRRQLEGRAPVEENAALDRALLNNALVENERLQTEQLRHEGIVADLLELLRSAESAVVALEQRVAEEQQKAIEAHAKTAALSERVEKLTGEHGDLVVQAEALRQEKDLMRGAYNRLAVLYDKALDGDERRTAETARLNARINEGLAQLSALEHLVQLERMTVLRPLLRHMLRIGGRAARRLPRPLQGLAMDAAYQLLKRMRPNHPRLRIYEEERRRRKFISHYNKTQSENRPLISGGLEASFIFFPVIDWHFRIQRPQHLAMALAKRGHKVIYLSTNFFVPDGERLFRILEEPCENVVICQLACDAPHPVIYRNLVQPPQQAVLSAALRQLQEHFGLTNVMGILHHPFWLRTAEQQGNVTIVYDCMDHHAGFSNNEAEILTEEDRLIATADQVIVTASRLATQLGKRNPPIIRNAAEVDFFSYPPGSLLWERKRPTVGYFGAISEWFDVDLLIQSAEAYPDWDFVLIGHVYGADIARASSLPNVHFLGEQAYVDLPAFLYAFDVCIIPFLVTELTLCTNPVKIYEYMSAGRPVVAVDLPEIAMLGDLVHVASTPDDFVRKLGDAMAEAENPLLSQKRMNWAKEQSWGHRANELVAHISARMPKVSVIVLCYNNLDFTKNCLSSIEQYTEYRNLELIVVDNGSSDGTEQYLRDFAASRKHVKVIINRKNLGFAAGNNVGLKAATGDYLILLNNDTYVTRGWIVPLLRHMRMEKELGLVGPVTNNIGNEARIEVLYANMKEMHDRAWQYTSIHAGERLEVDTVGFFCVVMRREVYEKVGGLDEDFKFGFFEDDDYCRRVRDTGYKVAIADDCFIHHHLSASFDALGAERKQEIFEANKRVYERKWGAWRPHAYRRR